MGLRGFWSYVCFRSAACNRATIASYCRTLKQNWPHRCANAFARRDIRYYPFTDSPIIPSRTVPLSLHGQSHYPSPLSWLRATLDGCCEVSSARTLFGEGSERSAVRNVSERSGVPPRPFCSCFHS